MTGIYRKITVEKVDRSDGIVTFEDKWFVLDQEITNLRTKKKYFINVVFKNGKTVELLSYDEWKPYDIIAGDKFIGD